MTLLVHSVKYIPTDEKSQQNEEPYTVFGEINQVMAQPDFYNNRWDFPNQRSLQMFFAG